MPHILFIELIKLVSMGIAHKQVCITFDATGPLGEVMAELEEMMSDIHTFMEGGEIESELEEYGEFAAANDNYEHINFFTITEEDDTDISHLLTEKSL